MADQPVEVFVQVAGDDLYAGTLWPHSGRQGDSASFEYAREYLADLSSYDLDPAMPRVAGRLQTRPGQALFGAVGDCAPDSWGRKLIQRANRADALRDNRPPRKVREIDFLLDVGDETRQGALRFQFPSGEFLATRGSGVPPFVDLPRLLNAATEFDSDTISESDLRLLLRAGSSLGGARPKAHVLDRRGTVLIAKFPRVGHDRWDVITWEAITLQLAWKAAITTAAASIEHVDGKPVLLLPRFDRDRDGHRIGYVSAMTVLETADGQTGDYFDLAQAVEQNSPSAIADLHQLWRRIVFGRLIHNTDDHLRNHGFLREQLGGWSLSPAFDLNPNPDPGEFRTTLGGEDGDRPDVLLDPAVAATFRLRPEQARAIILEIVEALASWREVANRMGAGSNEIELMAAAFESPAATSIRAALA